MPLVVVRELAKELEPTPLAVICVPMVKDFERLSEPANELEPMP